MRLRRATADDLDGLDEVFAALLRAPRAPLAELTDGAGNEEREPDARYEWHP